jgi:hypothetical protein
LKVGTLRHPAVASPPHSPRSSPVSETCRSRMGYNREAAVHQVLFLQPAAQFHSTLSKTS